MEGKWGSGNTSSYVGICMKYVTRNVFFTFFHSAFGLKNGLE